MQKSECFVAMPSMGRSDNALLVFRWLFRLVPMILYYPKVPFLSLEGAIGMSGKPHWNES